MRFHPAAVLVLLALVASAQAAPARGVKANPLVLGSEDLRIEQLGDGGYHLYLRAKPGLASVLLTESTRDPALKTDSFAYRSAEPSPVNGGETRVLDGKLLPSTGDLHFLVDSSPEPDPAFGLAFHIFIPWVVGWGYPWSRSGSEFIHDGSFINIRAFSKAHADYSGAFADNPYLIRVSQAPASPAAASPAAGAAATAAGVAAPPIPAAAAAAPQAAAPAAPASDPAKPVNARLYIPETLASFASIAKANRGELRPASGSDDIVSEIDAILERKKGRSLDLVLCLDTTSTMQRGLEALKAALPQALARRKADFPSLRMGLVAYKDYFEEYLYRRFDFVGEVGDLAAELDSLQSGGGRDIPEAVFEALYAASAEFTWAAQERLVILVGDAPPHPLPRGSVDGSSVKEASLESGLEIDAVAVPK